MLVHKIMLAIKEIIYLFAHRCAITLFQEILQEIQGKSRKYIRFCCFSTRVKKGIRKCRSFDHVISDRTTFKPESLVTRHGFLSEERLIFNQPHPTARATTV